MQTCSFGQAPVQRSTRAPTGTNLSGAQLIFPRSSSFVQKTAICKHSKPGRKEISGEVGRSMRNNDLADHGGGQRGEAEQADQIAALIEFFESLEKNLIPLVECTDVPPNSTHAKVKRFYKLLKIIKIGGQDIDPRFRIAFALIAVAFGAVKCGLPMYVLLGDMPWSIVFLYVVLIAFTFIGN